MQRRMRFHLRSLVIAIVFIAGALDYLKWKSSWGGARLEAYFLETTLCCFITQTLCLLVMIHGHLRSARDKSGYIFRALAGYLTRSYPKQTSSECSWAGQTRLDVPLKSQTIMTRDGH